MDLRSLRYEGADHPFRPKQTHAGKPRRGPTVLPSNATPGGAGGGWVLEADDHLEEVEHRLRRPCRREGGAPLQLHGRRLGSYAGFRGGGSVGANGLWDAVEVMARPRTMSRAAQGPVGVQLVCTWRRGPVARWMWRGTTPFDR